MKIINIITFKYPELIKNTENRIAELKKNGTYILELVLDNAGNMVRIENAIKTGLDNNLENTIHKEIRKV